jgi:hypothetical protein
MRFKTFLAILALFLFPCMAICQGNAVVVNGGAGSGITQVASLPGTCTAGTQYQLTGSPYTVSVCGPANTFTPVTGAGVGGSTNPAAPNMGIYLSNQCLTANTGQCYYTFADTLTFADCNWTNSTTTLNCTGSHFLSTDCVGGSGCTGTGTSKSIMGGQSCVEDNQGSGTGGQIATTTNVTIASFVSATQITLSATPANAVASNGCIVYGHLDDTGASAADTAWQAFPTCPKLFLAASYYFLASPHWFTQPTACSNMGELSGGYGSITLPAGAEIEGRGNLATTIFLNTNFPNGNACTNKSTASQTTGGCFAITNLGKWTNLHLAGGAQHTAPNLNGLVLLTMAIGTLEDFLCDNMGWLGTNSVGLNTGLLAQLYTVNLAGCGAKGWVIENSSSGGNVLAYRVAVENSPNALTINVTNPNLSAVCYGCFFSIPTSGANNSQVILNHGGVFKMYGGFVYPGASGSSNTGVTGYRCDTSPGSAYFDGVYFGENVGGALTNTAISDNATGCITTLIGSSILGQSSGASYTVSALGIVSTMYDLGGNTFSPPITAGNATVVADGHSLTGACTGTANASVTNSLYGTGPNITATTCSGQSATLGTGLPMAHAGTLAGFICTSSATTVSVACTVMVNGAASTITCTMTATTYCQDNTHSVAFNQGDLLSEKIVTGAAETGANIKAFVKW